MAAAYVPLGRTISTTSPLTGGGDLSANRTIAIPQSSGSVSGYLSSTDWGTFNGKVSNSGTPTSQALAMYNGTSGTLISPTGIIYQNSSGIGLTYVNGANVNDIYNGSGQFHYESSAAASAAAHVFDTTVSHSSGAIDQFKNNSTNIVQIYWNGSLSLSGQTNQLSISGGALLLDGSPISGGGSGYTTIQEEGSGLTARSTINFVGGAVTATDSGGTKTQVAITRTGVIREKWIPATDMRVGGAFAPAAGTLDIFDANWDQPTLDFDDTTQESAHYIWYPPSAWDHGTFKAKFAWSATSGTISQGIAWTVSASYINDGDDASITLVGSQTVVDTYQGSGLWHLTSATAAVTPYGTGAADSGLAVRVSRSPANGGDTKTGDGKFIGVWIQYTESTTEPSAW